jgi:hypothetical protein
VTPLVAERRGMLLDWGALMAIGLAAERRGNTWSTWTLE